jgi:hypothetical protein
MKACTKFTRVISRVNFRVDPDDEDRLASETLFFNLTLTRLIAQENLIAFIRRQNVKSYMKAYIYVSQYKQRLSKSNYFYSLCSDLLCLVMFRVLITHRHQDDDSLD